MRQAQAWTLQDQPRRPEQIDVHPAIPPPGASSAAQVCLDLQGLIQHGLRLSFHEHSGVPKPLLRDPSCRSRSIQAAVTEHPNTGVQYRDGGVHPTPRLCAGSQA